MERDREGFTVSVPRIHASLRSTSKKIEKNEPMDGTVGGTGKTAVGQKNCGVKTGTKRELFI